MMAITTRRSGRHGSGGWSLHFRMLAGLLAASALLGGSGAASPLRDLAMELLGLGLLGWMAFLPPAGAAALARRRWIAVLLACLFAVPVLQLIPLPPAIWSSFPGRSLAAQIAAAVLPGEWRPLSFDGPATLQWLVAFSVPVAAFLLACGLRENERERLLWAIVLVGCASALLGLAQLATGQLHLYVSAHNGFPIGLFANRNHQAAMMAVTLAITLLLAVRRLREGPLTALAWPYVPIVLLAVAVALLTQSRAGAALLGLSVLPALLMLRKTASGAIALGGALLVCLGAVWLLFTGSGQGIFARMLDSGGDERFASWEDVWFMVTYHFPFGTGLGTFTRAFQPVESLATVSRTYLNHAHCDYLEIIAEAGALGVLAILAALGFVLVGLRRILRLPATGEGMSVAVAALTVVVLVMAHSLVDYPARTFLIGVIVAAMAGLLSALPGTAKSEAEREPRPLPRAVGVAAVILFLAGAVQAALLAFSSATVSHDGTQRPFGPPADSDAHARLAELALTSGDLPGADQQAVAALRASAYNSLALQVLGEAALSRGRMAQAVEFLNLSSRVTWRNTDVQWWKLRQSLAEGTMDAAVNSGDALLRRGRFAPEVRAAFIAIAAKADTRVPLAQRLADDNPPWAPALLPFFGRVGPEHTQDMLAFLQDAMKRGYRPDAAALQPFFEQAFAQGRGDAVLPLVRLANPSVMLDPRKGPVDSHFGAVAADHAPWGPFGWRIGDDAAYFEDVHTGEEQLLRVSRAGGGDVLYQRLLLPAGRYALRGGAAAKGTEDGLARWRIECADARPASGRRQLVRLAIGGPEHRADAARFAVMPDCPSQILTLEIVPSSDAEVSLGRIAIEPAR